MNIQALLTSVLLVMFGFIIFLAFILYEPPTVVKQLTFGDVINMSSDLRGSLKEVNITYGVNLSINGLAVLGEMNFFQNDSYKEVTLTPEIRDYEGYGILLSPDRIMSFILVNSREEYAGELENEHNLNPCWSTITEPTGRDFKRVINGDYVFITCIDEEIGYPSTVYAGELTDDGMAYSKIFIKNVSYIV